MEEVTPLAHAQDLRHFPDITESFYVALVESFRIFGPVLRIGSQMINLGAPLHRFSDGFAIHQVTGKR